MIASYDLHQVITGQRSKRTSTSSGSNPFQNGSGSLIGPEMILLTLPPSAMKSVIAKILTKVCLQRSSDLAHVWGMNVTEQSEMVISGVVSARLKKKITEMIL